jgi:hypothetical protein
VTGTVGHGRRRGRVVVGAAGGPPGDGWPVDGGDGRSVAAVVAGAVGPLVRSGGEVRGWPVMTLGFGRLLVVGAGAAT